MSQPLLMFLVCFIFVLIVLLVVISVYIGQKLLHPRRKPITNYPEDYGLSVYDCILFPSRDQLKMKGWYFSAAKHQEAHLKQMDEGADMATQESQHVQSLKHATIIVAHGYRQNRLEQHLPALTLAKSFVEAGYDAILFDFRNAGESEGSLTTIGLYEQKDLLGAIDFAKKRAPGHSIGLIGFSMGAATSLMVAGEDERVNAVVADCSFALLSDYLSNNLPIWTRLPSFPFTSIILTVIPILVGASPKQVKPIEAVKRYGSRPLLLIHGREDKTIPYKESEKLYEAAMHPEAELWLVPEADHVRCYTRDRELYSRRVLQFFDRYVGESPNK
ncbi:alpha/beta hydrolase [Brevibacillus laterosporus]|uniref:alpha/beta hydrolase n=1 Tax=Brevibacillus laterosporus TaxID=1465 RepID=UPI0018CEFABC|nr:alpha/beta hydrolase [Brevibacillus laterosporus]MCR8939322.1 alpha/beta hydrolase [Brevibacillus laterosporus]MCZ0841962.1 alpha/beta hydrolase [Brevibacillus laterosporus]MCZ0845982.1 alpha/beta hydrolase [Brevibacillus laterosporus]MED1909678.1 alpha/beta hydrolase [Brevibacillus laterosporus]